MGEVGESDPEDRTTKGATAEAEADALAQRDGPHAKRVPTQARALATYESIVAAATELAASQSPPSLTVADITDAAGVSKGAFYGYFAGMDELVEEVRSRVRAEYFTYMAEFFANETFASAEDVLVELVHWYADYFRANALARRLFLERGHDIGTDPLTGPHWEIRRPWRLVLTYLDGAGLLSRPVDDELVDRAEALYGQFESMIDLAFRRDPTGDPRIIALIDEMLAMQAAHF